MSKQPTGNICIYLGLLALLCTSLPAASQARDGQHDFDFDLGNWTTHSTRLLHPLTGSTTWVEMDGSTIVKKIWGGRANLAEFKSDGPAGHLELLSLRWYNPNSQQWYLDFATPNVGKLGDIPCIGEFKSGRGDFYDQESIGGRTILVRFSIWGITANTAQSEQAFSDDGGKTWEVNWINHYTRMNGGVSQEITAAVGDTFRPAADIARDAARKPAESPADAEVRPGSVIADFKAYATGRANVTVKVASALESLRLPNKLDLFWISQNYHDLHDEFFGPVDIAAFNRAVYDALKPGGVYIVLDHRAAVGAAADVTETLHRIDPVTVRREVEEAGFQFEGESTILSNPADPRTI